MLKVIKQIIIDTLAPNLAVVLLYLLIVANLLQNLVFLTDPDLPPIARDYIYATNWLIMLTCLFVTAFFYAVKKQLQKLTKINND